MRRRSLRPLTAQKLLRIANPVAATIRAFLGNAMNGSCSNGVRSGDGPNVLTG
jgi:hypothetical protein